MPEDVRLTAPRTNNNAEAINRSEQRVQRSNATLVVQVEEEFEFVKAQEVEYRRINRGETGRHSGLRRISKGKGGREHTHTHTDTHTQTHTHTHTHTHQ